MGRRTPLQAVRRPPASPTPHPSLAARIVDLEAQLATLRAEQRVALVRAIAIIIGPGVVFTALALWKHRRVNVDLRDALDQLHVSGPRSLGRHLQQLHDDPDLPGVAIERHGEDNRGKRWAVAVRDNYHQRACLTTPPGA